MTDRRNNIIAFPRELIADAKIREAERMIKKLLQNIEDGARNPADMDAQIRAAVAPPMLEMWREMLTEAQLLKESVSSDDALRHGGIVYRAYPSQRGAH